MQPYTAVVEEDFNAAVFCMAPPTIGSGHSVASYGALGHVPPLNFQQFYF